MLEYLTPLKTQNDNLAVLPIEGQLKLFDAKITASMALSILAIILSLVAIWKK